MAYNRALADLNDLEDILVGSHSEADQDIWHNGIYGTLPKGEDDIDDFGSAVSRNLALRYPFKTKRNYNLDHLARMNFRRSDPALVSYKRIHPSKFNDRHILGGLRRKK